MKANYTQCQAMDADPSRLDMFSSQFSRFAIEDADEMRSEIDIQ